MNRSLKKTGAAGLATAALVAGVLTAGGSGSATADGSDDREALAAALGMDGLTLSTIELDGGRRAKPVGRISGLDGDAKIMDIDVRPATGALYGVGNASGVYRIDLATAAATKVGTLTAAGATVALSGSIVAIDFNPTVDRLRVVTNMGQNLRVNVDGGATTVDTPLTGNGVVAIGYTNNDAAASTATTLYDLTGPAALTIQAPPNNGSLNLVGTNVRGVADVTGFDIASKLNDDGVTTANRAYVVAKRAGRTGLFTLDVTSADLRFQRPLDASIERIAILPQD